MTGAVEDWEEEIARRLETAKVELAAESEFDATVVNASVEGAVASLLDLMGLHGPGDPAAGS